jgi:hypothetical protein
MGTSALRMIEEIEGQLIRIGEGGQNLNPLMVYYDSERHGNSITGMKRAYIRHKEAVSNFANIIVGSTFSSTMAGVFKRTLSELYEEKGFVDGNANPLERSESMA